MQRTVPLFILTVTGKFMPKDLLYQNRVPSTMCHKRIQGRYSMLELDEGKLSRPVLRRGVRGNSDPLADARACPTHPFSDQRLPRPHPLSTSHNACTAHTGGWRTPPACVAPFERPSPHPRRDIASVIRSCEGAETRGGTAPRCERGTRVSLRMYGGTML